MDVSHYQEENGFFFHKDTNNAVRKALIAAFENHSTVRIWLGDTLTGTAWAEEHDVMGTVGRSCGPVKVPLLVEAGEDGGGHMLDRCVIRIDIVKRIKLKPSEVLVDGSRSRSVLAGTTVYAHPSFNCGEWTLQVSELKGYAVEVMLDGQIHARFRTEKLAPKYIGFMRGDSYAQT